jgi:hypothetical protein
VIDLRRWSSSVEDPGAEEVEVGAAEHLPLDHFDIDGWVPSTRATP